MLVHGTTKKLTDDSWDLQKHTKQMRALLFRFHGEVSKGSVSSKFISACTFFFRSFSYYIYLEALP